MLKEEELSRWIIAQRPAREEVDPFKPHGFFLEQERSASGRIVSSGCILLTNKECPWRCLMCDLWKHTLTGPTPPGAIAKQIAFALEHLGQPAQLKLYNSGSFFDAAAIPPGDYPSIVRTISFAEHVVVESHPRLIGPRTLRLRDLLAGSLEIAMGLETVHPQVLPRLNKRFDLKDFAHAAGWLRRESILLRAFILIQPPFLKAPEAVLWGVKSAEFAFGCGASAVSLIPTRSGNGALDRLMSTGEFAPPRIETVEDAFEAVLALKQGRAFVDTWNLEESCTCPACLPDRKRRLEQMNLSQRILPKVVCFRCREAAQRL